MGSNTTRLIVADVERDADGVVTHQAVVRRTTITRLAEGVDARGILLPEPITRVRNALIDYRREARELGAVFVLATATSAVRDADNGEAFLGEVEHGFAFRAELLSGDQEAAATWEGVTSDPELARRTSAGTGLLVDIGGGSAEILLSDRGSVHDVHSFQLGGVRLTERFLHTDPPTSDELAAARAAALSELAARFPEPATPDLAIAVAGVATTVSSILLGNYDPDQVHGFEYDPAQLGDVVTLLASMPLAEREQVPGLEPKRAPVILGGLVILQAVLEHFAIAAIVTSERDILDGIARMAGRIALDEGIDEMPQPFGATVC
jgi:exopolyphosphatase/guanosine-5'-triphosphate,3'-diphosphate pyrophosphatase